MSEIISHEGSDQLLKKIPDNKTDNLVHLFESQNHLSLLKDGNVFFHVVSALSAKRVRNLIIDNYSKGLDNKN